MRRFFCENCGAEVSERDELCNACGAIFVAIKCPRCGYRGKQHRFARGCPQCGYLGADGPTDTQTITRHAEQPDQRPDQTGRPADHTHGGAPARRPMPAWVFWVVLAALAASFLILARIYATL